MGSRPMTLELITPDGSGLLLLATAHWWIGYCLAPYVHHAR